MVLGEGFVAASQKSAAVAPLRPFAFGTTTSTETGVPTRYLKSFVSLQSTAQEVVPHVLGRLVRLPCTKGNVWPAIGYEDIRNFNSRLAGNERRRPSANPSMRSVCRAALAIKVARS